MRRWFTRAPGVRDLVSMALAGLGRQLLRRPPLSPVGLVSEESPVIITGMHRSGTSLVARLLERGGMYVGGSWVDRNHESIYFKRANMKITGEGYYKLHDYGWAAPKTDDFFRARQGYAERAATGIASFFAERAGQDVWGWKDPRNCLTLPMWLAVYPSARVLHVVRDGRAVALSLTDRDGLHPAFALALWAQYLTRAERAMEALPDSRKLTITFERLAEAPEPTLRSLYQFADLALPEAFDAIIADIDTGRASAWAGDTRLADIGDHPLLGAYGYH